MPRRFRKTRARRKPRVRRNRRNRRTRGGRGRSALSYKAPGKNPFPLKLYTKFTFSETFEMAHDGAGVKVILFRGASPYDAYAKIGGVSDAGWVQASQIYGKYRCFGSKIDAKCQLISASGGLAATKFMVVPSLSDSPIVNAALAHALPWSKLKFLDSNTRNVATIKSYHKVRTMNSLRIADEYWYTDTNADQTPGFFWHVITAVPTATVVTFNVTITMTFYCEMSRPVEPRIFEVDPVYEAAADALEQLNIDHNVVDLQNAIEVPIHE